MLKEDQRPRLSARLPLAVVSTAIVVMASTSCSWAAPEALPPSPPVVPVAMHEYRFEHQKRVSPGRVLFRVRNTGKLAHQLLLARIPAEVTGSIDDQLRSQQRRPVAPLLSLPLSPPGQMTVFAADLTSGRYAFVCFVPDADGTSHALKGMSSEFMAQ